MSGQTMRTYVRKRPQHRLIEDVHQLCRLCLQKCTEQKTIYDDDSAVCPLALRINMCVGLEVTKEPCLSNIICKECFQKLDQIYEFRKKCELTYRKLKSHMLALKQNVLIHNKQKSKKLKLEYCDNEETDDDSILEEKFHNNIKTVSQEHSQIFNVDSQDTNLNKNLPEDCKLINGETESCKNENLEPTPKPPEPHLPEKDGVIFSTFLTNLLVKVGVLVLHDDGTLSMPVDGTNTIHLDMGDQNQMTIQLAEEEEHTFVEPSLSEVTNESLLETANDDAIHTEEDVIGKYMIKDNKPKMEMEYSDPFIRLRKGVECGKCGKVLSSRGVLNRHERVHSDERAYPCTTCGRAFHTGAARNRHQHVHDANRPFACTLCPKSFTQRENLEQHVVSHCAVTARPRQLFHCRDCPKVFLYRSGLSRHSSFCSGGRCYTCAGCGRAFNDRGSLLRHLRTVCPGRDSNNVNTTHDDLATTQNECSDTNISIISNWINV